MSDSKVKILLQNENAKIPVLATVGSAGYDVFSCENCIIKPKEFVKVSTGIKISMSNDMEAQIRPRSGLAFKHGVTILNAPGTIDSDYRGEVCILLINHSNEPFEIKPGMRIAQMVFSKKINVNFERVNELDDSSRGDGGFGSTGLK